MNNFELFHTINLSNFLVKLYCADHTTSVSSTSSKSVIDINAIDELKDSLNSQTFPRHIVEMLENIEGITKIEVLDHNNKILLTSQIFF